MTYFLRAVNYKNTTIELGNEVLAKLSYKGWACTKAQMHFPECDYTFGKENMWGTRLKIRKNGVPIGKVKSNWKGHVLIDIHEEYKKPIHIEMKYRGLLKPRKEVFLNGQHILTMRAKYSWTKTHYEIELHEAKDRIPYPVEELLGILAYGARYQMNMQGV